MEAFFAQLAGMPLLQGALVAVTTVVTEDPTTLASGLLVAGGQMTFVTAWLGLAVGVILGDTLLYVLGRLVGPKVEAWNVVEPEKLARATRWFDRYGMWVLVGARCVPGSRVPTYAAAGILHCRAAVFLGTVIPTSLVWTFLLTTGISQLGEAVLPYVKNVQWLFLITLVVFVANLWVVRRARKRARQREAAASEATA